MDARAKGPSLNGIEAECHLQEQINHRGFGTAILVEEADEGTALSANEADMRTAKSCERGRLGNNHVGTLEQRYQLKGIDGLAALFKEQLEEQLYQQKWMDGVTVGG